MEHNKGAIAAIATPAGIGAIGVVRISGAELDTIASQLIGKLPCPRRASLRTVYAADRSAIDDAIVIYFAAPASFTGEDVLEIQTHGGNVVTHDVLQAAIAAGARRAEPGEFSTRAFLNNKIDLVQAEAIADLIESTSSRAARLAHNSLSGKFSGEITTIAEALKALRVELEAYIDFPEDDIPAPAIDSLSVRTGAVHDRLLSLANNAERGAKLNTGLDVAIVGRPNVGKSTLLNTLAQEERAIVSSEPGTTRDVLSIDVIIDGLAVRFHDTAGLRDSDNIVEQEGVRRARQTVERCDVIFYLISGHDEPLEKPLNEMGVPTFTIRNKIDLAGLAPKAERTANGGNFQISAKHGDGIELLRRALLEHFDLDGETDSAYLARKRQLDALQTACAALDFDYAKLYLNAPELGAERLRSAGYALATLTGEYTSEDLLGDIFSTFCIGK